MRGEKIRDFLDRNNVNYEAFSHPITYSAQMTAHKAHIHGKDFAKPIIVKIMGKMMMIVVTANQKINLRLLKNLYNTEEVELAKESEFINIFPDCEPGAMPPFGPLYGMEEIISSELSKDKEIVFNAGTHSDLIRMKFNDFQKIVNPKIINFKIEL